MNILLISSGPDIANLRYATGFSAPDPVVYVKKGRKGFLLVPLLEKGRARKEALKTTVVTPDEIQLDKSSRSLSAWCEGLLRYLNINEVVISSHFPFSVADTLKRKKFNVSVCDDALFPNRIIKNENEIKKIQQSQRCAVRAMKEAMALIKAASIDAKHRLVYDGKLLTSERVREAIEWSLLKDQCGFFDTIVAGGRQATDPHESGHGPLRADQPIVIDIFPFHRKHGYYGDITRTVIKSKPTAKQKALYNTVVHAQKTALSMVKPGVKASAIHQRVNNLFSAAGYETQVKNGVPEGFFHGTGHGVGLDIHESPSVSIRPDVLKKGHVITIEPGLYYPGLGGVRIEDTVAVTADGYRMLAGCGKVFHLGG